MITLLELFQLGKLNRYGKECTKLSRWKETTQRYIANILVNNILLQKDILNGTYKVSPTTNFYLNERGHIRFIEAPAIRDRIVQKAITNEILFPALSKHLIYDNYASMPNRGTSFARKRFEIMLKRYIHKNGTDGYIMLLDIRKYFENIDHNVLKELIYPYIKEQPQDVVNLIYYIIDTSSHSNKGLNLGSEAPQILAIYYLNKVDTFAKIVKSINYYGRYMDDIFIIGKSKKELQDLFNQIELVLHTLKLELNKKKSCIIKLTHGFTYLLVKYNITYSGKLIKRPSHSKIVRERRRLKAFKRLFNNNKVSFLDIEECYKSWRGTFIKEHNSYIKSLLSMDKLFDSLFKELLKDKLEKINKTNSSTKINTKSIKNRNNYKNKYKNRKRNKHHRSTILKMVKLEAKDLTNIVQF